MTRYELWIDTAEGRPLALVNAFTRLSVSLVANGIGVYSVLFPLAGFNTDLLQADNRVRLYRDAGGGLTLIGNTAFMMRAWEIDYSPGVSSVIITAYHPLYLLGNPAMDTGRIVAYNAGSAQASIAAKEIDDAMKDIVRQNIGSSATAARDRSTYLTVATDRGEGPTTTKGFSRQNALLIMQELHAESARRGTPVYFDIRQGADGNYIFDTYLNQLGVDRSDKVVFSPEFGNIASARIKFDYTDEVTTAYAGGYGIEDNRDVQEDTDSDRENRSIWARRETFSSHYSKEDDALTSYAKAIVYAGRPLIVCDVVINNTPFTSLGVHFNYGDKARVNVRGISFVGAIDVMNIDYERGQEDIDIKLVKNV